jgi:hypothetical protein
LAPVLVVVNQDSIESQRGRFEVLARDDRISSFSGLHSPPEGRTAAGWNPWAGRPRQADGALAMHFDAHQPIINDLEARISTIRDSL